MEDSKYDKSNVDPKLLVTLVVGVALVGIVATFFWTLLRKAQLENYLATLSSNSSISSSIISITSLSKFSSASNPSNSTKSQNYSN